VTTPIVLPSPLQGILRGQNGLISTSTRNVIIEPAAAPSIIPTDDASTTEATSTQ
jgi:hypothetical protein